MEIGAFPTSDNTCSMWKTTYTESGSVTSVKDYKLCRGGGPEDIYIDEGGGVKLSARVIGDSLIVPFRSDKTLLVSTYRLRGEVLELEILTVEDTPATTSLQPMQAKGIQRIELKRVGESK